MVRETDEIICQYLKELMCADSTLFECDLHVKQACVGEIYFMPLEEVHSFAFQELNQYAEVLALFTVAQAFM